MTGPDAAPEQVPVEKDDCGPPGHFLSAELESDCVRFLDSVKVLVRRRAEAGLEPAEPRPGG